MNDLLIEDLPPWDRGRLLAHSDFGGADRQHGALSNRQSQRKGIFVWILPDAAATSTA